MIDLTKLQCIFVDKAANLANKIAVGADCGKNINEVYKILSILSRDNPIYSIIFWSHGRDFILFS